MPKLMMAFMFALAFASCSYECVHAPCALPLNAIAINLDVTSQASGAGVSASVQVSGTLPSTVSCDASCQIKGPYGTYVLTLTAPGYQTTERTVVVQASTSGCGCAGVATEHVSVALAPAS